ncbi:MAG: response regulator [Chitinophagaceae bacterium]|nr:response regulator [Chitinophagaceae bacterium]
MKKLLIAEDDKVIGELIQHFLSASFKVKRIKNPDEILRTVHEMQPDIILMDIHMGNMNGKDICRVIKTQAHTTHIPVVLMSASNIKDEDFADSRYDAFLKKPFSMHDLEATLKKLVAGKASQE